MGEWGLEWVAEGGVGNVEESSAREGGREMEGTEPCDGGLLRDGVKERGRGDLEWEEERLVITGVLSLPFN